MPTMLAIGAGVGLLKSEAIDKPAADRQRKLQAATARFSPWTHLAPQAVKEADPFGAALQYGATGAAMGSGMKGKPITGIPQGNNGAESMVTPTSNPWSMQGNFNYGSGNPDWWRNSGQNSGTGG